MPNALPAGNPLIQYLTIMARYKRLVIAIVLLTTISTAIYSLVMDKTYQSRAVIMPPTGSSSPIAGLLGNLPMGSMLGDLGGIAGGSGEYYFVTILNSRQIREELVSQFNLREHYSMEKADIEDVLTMVSKKVTASLNVESGMIDLSAQDKDPQLAFEMAEWLIQRLEVINRDLKSHQARNNREFLQKEVTRIRTDLDSLEGVMLAFQKDSKLLEPEKQAQAILEEYANIKSQEAVKELELRLARQNFGESHPRIRQLENELASIRKLRKESYESGDSELFMAIRNLPSASMDYLRHKRELEIANQKLMFMLPQLEQAKIDEINKLPVLQVLDPPRKAEKRIKPKRTIMVLLSGFIAWIMASAIVLFLHRKEEDEDFASQLSMLGHSLRKKKS